MCVCVCVWMGVVGGTKTRDWEHNRTNPERNKTKGANKLLAVNVWSTVPCCVATNHTLTIIRETQVTDLQVKGWLSSTQHAVNIKQASQAKTTEQSYNRPAYMVTNYVTPGVDKENERVHRKSHQLLVPFLFRE